MARVIPLLFVLLFANGCEGVFWSQLELTEIGCSNDTVCLHPLEIADEKYNEKAVITRANFVRQDNQTGCGAAVLSSVVSYWGKTLSYKEIIEKHPQKSDLGYTVGELKKIANAHGLLAYSLIMNEKILKEQIKKGRPVIIPVKIFFLKAYKYLPEFLPFLDNLTFSHFLVVFGFDQDNFWVMNPANGYERIKSEDLINSWKRHNYAGLLISK